MCSVSAPTISPGLGLIKGPLFWPVCNTWRRFSDCFHFAKNLNVPQEIKLIIFFPVAFCYAELGRKREWLWSCWMLQGSAFGSKCACTVCVISLIDLSSFLWMTILKKYFRLLVHEQKYPPSATTLHFEFYAEPASEVKLDRKVKAKIFSSSATCMLSWQATSSFMKI